MKILFLLASMVPVFACQIVEGEHILGKDLSAASALFASLNPSVEIGASPIAGVQRVLRPEELVRLARQNGIELTEVATAVCFERATRQMTVEQLMPILRQALSMDNAQIEILDFSHFGVPRGTFEFPKSGLMPNGLWRGRLLYEQGHSMPVWVKARITVEKTWVEAAEPLAMGKPINGSQLIVKNGPRFPFDTAFVDSLELVAGRRPVRTLPAGTAIASPMLMIAHDVERGDMVDVEVKVGAATLSFQATAESSGRTGDSVMVKNPDNGKSFLAKIQDKGHVLVER
jgi:flagella basal body P-ring formation protein FlgA